MGYKLKTNSGAAKRFKVRKSGKVKFARAYARHCQLSKNAKTNRRLRGMGTLDNRDARKVKQLFPYGSN
jgi:large subunit ribosomal protein L35